MSVASECSDADPEEVVTTLFASGAPDAIVTGLLDLRTTLMHDAPDTVYLFFQDHLPDAWRAAAHPHALLLHLLGDARLQRRPGDKADLPVLLARALRRAREIDDDQDGGDEGGASPSCELTPELVEQAKKLCLEGPHLSPRAFEAVARLFQLDLTEGELVSYASSAFEAGLYRECAEFLKAFRIESDAFPHDALLAHLVSDRQCMDVFTAYLSQSESFLRAHAHRALTQLAEYPQPGVVYSQELPRPGHDANLAAKLATKFGLSLAELPRISYLKMSDVIWWICRINKAGEFGLLLCGDDRSLQRKLLKELMRSRNTADQVLAASFLERWRHFLTDSTEHRDFFRRAEEVLSTEKSTWVEPGTLFKQEMDRALELPVDATSTSLLLPALTNSNVGLTLPQLFLRPDSIVMVDSLASLSVAQRHLRSSECRVIGIDLEHLPENLVDLNVKPTLCQVLQISCKTKVFLFDLQVMHLPDDQDANAAKTSAAAAVPSAGDDARELIFPPLPAFNPSCTPTTPSLASGVADLLLSLFLDSDLLKVGIGFAQDLRKLRQDFPSTVAFQVTLQHYVDLTPLLKLVPDPDAADREAARRRTVQQSRANAAARKAAAKAQKQSLLSGSPTCSPSPPLGESESRGYTHASKKEGGLLKLVRILLRRHLDKSDQLSNWSQRPLTLAQQQYAALDAYVCGLILEEAQRRGIELEAENIEPTHG